MFECFIIVFDFQFNDELVHSDNMSYVRSPRLEQLWSFGYVIIVNTWRFPQAAHDQETSLLRFNPRKSYQNLLKWFNISQ